ncbi:hypothetical protein NL676_001894 [Syzygium grande]|nr:hypothetical protein NL676_001894 [Syzygium grande]
MPINNTDKAKTRKVSEAVDAPGSGAVSVGESQPHSIETRKSKALTKDSQQRLGNHSFVDHEALNTVILGRSSALSVCFEFIYILVLSTNLS